MIAISAGGDHIQYVFGMLTQMSKLEPQQSNTWTAMAGISSGAMVCASICQLPKHHTHSEYVAQLASLTARLRKRVVVERWNSLGDIINMVEAMLYHNSVFKNTLPMLVLSEIQQSTLESSDNRLYIGAYNMTRGCYHVFKDKQNIVNKLCASASVPAVFPPVEIDGCEYVDGGVVHILPVVSIVEWCDSNNGPVDIFCCYPIKEYDEFVKTDYCKSRRRIANVASHTAISVLWNNLQRDLKALQKYFNIQDMSDGGTWNVDGRRVRLFAPTVGVYSDFASMDRAALTKMFDHGVGIANRVHGEADHN